MCSTVTRSIKICGVIDDTTNELRYVGKTVKSLKTRLASHYKTHGSSHRALWFAKMEREHRPLSILLIEDIKNDGNWGDS